MNNNNLEKEYTDKNTGLSYTLVGDYYLPNIAYDKNENIEKNLLRLEYLRNHKKGYYNYLMITGGISFELKNIDRDATEKVNKLIKEIAKQENITEELKASNQMEWVQAMNNIKNRAEEIVLKELIYN